MNRTLPGRYLKPPTAGEAFKAFVPAPLPPRPAIEWTGAARRFDAALVALGRLDAVTDLLPNAALLLYSFVRKEAVLSSMIEGTQSSLADLLLFELDEQPGVPVEDAREVSRYVAALEHGLKRLRGGFPLALRLLREMHKVLLGSGGAAASSRLASCAAARSGSAARGPATRCSCRRRPMSWTECLKRFERFLNDEPEPTPPLIKAALAHVQFETIHPFLDGNGRVGRLLIALQLAADGVLREPMLYLSLYFKKHRQTYYELLNAVRLRATGRRWLEFFAEAVEASATQAATIGEAPARAGLGGSPAHRGPRPRRGVGAGDSPGAAAPADRHRCVARRPHGPHAGHGEQVAGASGAHRRRGRSHATGSAAACSAIASTSRNWRAELEAPAMSQFAFLQREWPAVFEAAARAEAAVHADPRTACFYARRALELAVAWAYKHDAALKLPYQDNLSALIHEPSFKQAAGEAVFSKARVINTLGNRAVHSHRAIPPDDALVAVRELFHVAYWLARTYGRAARPAPGLAFDASALPKADAGAAGRPPSSCSSSKRACASATRSSRRCWPTRPRSTRS